MTLEQVGEDAAPFSRKRKRDLVHTPRFFPDKLLDIMLGFLSLATIANAS